MKRGPHSCTPPFSSVSINTGFQDVGSKAEISLDGKALEKNKEYKISVGQELKIGDDALYQVIATKSNMIIISQCLVSQLQLYCCECPT